MRHTQTDTAPTERKPGLVVQLLHPFGRWPAKLACLPGLVFFAFVMWPELFGPSRAAAMRDAAEADPFMAELIGSPLWALAMGGMAWAIAFWALSQVDRGLKKIGELRSMTFSVWMAAGVVAGLGVSAYLTLSGGGDISFRRAALSALGLAVVGGKMGTALGGRLGREPAATDG